jgi:FAD:protein FMN transferase
MQMGTRVRIVLHAESEEHAREGAAAAFDRIAALERIMTDYDASSELMTLCSRASGSPQTVSADLYAVLARSVEYARLSGGAFDPTVGPIVALWRAARRSRALPEPAAIESALARVSWRRIALDLEARTVRLSAGTRLDLGGIGKGFAADRALEELQGRGIRSALVVAGGDMSLGDPPPGAVGWRIAIANPGLPPERAPGELSLSNCGVATSGDAEQFLEVEGRRYSHVVDPRSGQALGDAVSATVVAPDGTAADALATALGVLGPAEGITLADRLDGVAAFLVQRGSDGLRCYTSRRMQPLLSAK